MPLTLNRAQLDGMPRPVARLIEESVTRRTLTSPAIHASGTPEATIGETFTASHVRVVHEMYRHAERMGVAGAVTAVRSAYTGSSWGIEFQGDAAAIRRLINGGRFCRDIQEAVRPFHGNTAHEWWRELPDSGNTHIGLDAGAGYFNIHSDSTNPVSSDTRPCPPGSGSCTRTCDYSALGVALHNIDVQTSAGGNHPQPFTRMEPARFLLRSLTELINREAAHLGDNPSAEIASLHADLSALLASYGSLNDDLIARAGEFPLAAAAQARIASAIDALEASLGRYTSALAHVLRQEAFRAGAVRAVPGADPGAVMAGVRPGIIGWRRTVVPVTPQPRVVSTIPGFDLQAFEGLENFRYADMDWRTIRRMVDMHALMRQPR